jgi:hypothetical protein
MRYSSTSSDPKQLFLFSIAGVHVHRSLKQTLYTTTVLWDSAAAEKEAMLEVPHDGKHVR